MNMYICINIQLHSFSIENAQDFFLIACQPESDLKESKLNSKLTLT